MELVTSWTTLMYYAKKLGEARLTGDEAKIAEAKKRHDEYAAVCVKSDRMILNCTDGDYDGERIRHELIANARTILDREYDA